MTFLITGKMKKRFEEFLAGWAIVSRRPQLKEELKELYFLATGKEAKCGKNDCLAAAVREIAKYNSLKLEADSDAKPRRYTLKPGNHAFAFGGPSIHNNANTSDETIEAHLITHPHIKNLLIHE